MRECGSNPKLSYIGCQKINSAQCKTCTHLSKGSNPLRIAQEEAGAARLAMLGQQTSNIIPLRPSTGAAFADPNAPAARAPATKNDSAAKPAKLTIIETRLRHSKHTFSYDLFSYENLVDGERLTDHHLRALRVEITKVGGINLGKDDTYDMIKFLCHEHRFNPVLDYLNKLEWDGVARVDTWLQTYAGAKNVPFTRAAGRKWLIAMVRRVRQPGCKFDYALIFEGPQRRGKSSAGKTLAGGPKYFSDNDIVALDANKQIELLSGKWVVELAEIDKLSRHEAGIVKSFMSRSHDKARLAWAKETEERARNCVFFGTCNKSEYLRDETGNMRYWPVAITGFDLPALERDRDQLLAEAAHLERSEASLELPPEVIPDALKAQEERRQRHDWEDVIEKLVGTGFTYKQKQIEFISNDSIFQHLGIDMKSRNGGAGSQLSGLMKLYGWTPSGKPVRIPGAQRVERGYFRRAP
jgi:putative DNA primase/helicase